MTFGSSPITPAIYLHVAELGSNLLLYPVSVRPKISTKPVIGILFIKPSSLKGTLWRFTLYLLKTLEGDKVITHYLLAFQLPYIEK